MTIWRESIRETRTSKNKGSEGETCFFCSRRTKFSACPWIIFVKGDLFFKENCLRGEKMNYLSKAKDKFLYV